MTKKQHYMTYSERLKLEALHNTAKMSVAAIAKALGFCRQTIYNELKIGAYIHTCEYYDEERYSADKAQQIHDYQQSGKGRPEKIGSDHEYANFLESMILESKFSPAAALAEARKQGFQTAISVGTLYNYIDKGLFLRLSNKHLWEKSKRKKTGSVERQRIAHPKLPSIEDRPQEINARSERGHWEMDLIVGKQNTRPVLLTLTERVTRWEYIFLLPDRKAATIRAALDALEAQTPDFKTRFKSITTDNGSEFMQYDKLQESIYGGKRFELYYCHSFAAWEKGSNENQNRMIRRWFPKGTDFGQVTNEEIAAIQEWMNGYPRKILEWRTPKEMAA